MNGEAEDEEGGNDDESVVGDEEEVVMGGGNEEGAGRDDEGDGGEGEFGEGAKESEREGFGVAGGGFSATVGKAGDGFGKPKFGRGAAAVVEKPHDEGEGDEGTDDDVESAVGEGETEEAVNDEAGDAE